jgi:hypothetical protein
VANKVALDKFVREPERRFHVPTGTLQVEETLVLPGPGIVLLPQKLCLSAFVWPTMHLGVPVYGLWIPAI